MKLSRRMRRISTSTLALFTRPARTEKEFQKFQGEQNKTSSDRCWDRVRRRALFKEALPRTTEVPHWNLETLREAAV